MQMKGSATNSWLGEAAACGFHSRQGDYYGLVTVIMSSWGSDISVDL